MSNYLTTAMIDDLLAAVDSDQSRRVIRGKSLMTGEDVVFTVQLSSIQEQSFREFYASLFCPTCGSLSCPNVKNAAAMCPGPAP